MTFKESIEKYVKEGYTPIDKTCNNRCSKCGECCGTVLPIDQKDANKIQEYVVKHNILPQKHLLIMTNKLQCPYYTGKEEGCSIYEARPKICRNFKCNKMPTFQELLNMKDCVPVDMWAFAIAIEEEMKKNEVDKKNGKTTKQSI